VGGVRVDKRDGEAEGKGGCGQEPLLHPHPTTLTLILT
jgi:hypothetical protein